ncbi:MAG: formylglycine-generating enzyme family protein, partial [Verrucomicrobia bacterium]|nr:formylglycine-generating enzyme family protein [Verrucomicrobiota bacterium]
YYIGVFECTQKQWELVMGTKPSWYNNATYYATRPVETISFSMIRGSGDDGWPAYGHAVDASSFMGKLQAKTGLTFDLPTEAQWEYACRAGTQTPLYSGAELTSMSICPNVDALAWYGGNEIFLHPVGLKEANCWGFYDMVGNAEEMCLDYWVEHLGIATATDPYYVAEDGSCVGRGGCFDSTSRFSWEYARTCRSAFRRSFSRTGAYGNGGFRVALVPNEYKVRKPTVPVLPEPEE